jgi:hypothetical protein
MLIKDPGPGEVVGPGSQCEADVPGSGLAEQSTSRFHAGENERAPPERGNHHLLKKRQTGAPDDADQLRSRSIVPVKERPRARRGQSCWLKAPRGDVWRRFGAQRAPLASSTVDASLT